jgi:GAF domain-containing protein
MNRAHGLSAVMAAPLAIRGRTVGALIVGDVRGRHYSEDDHRLLAAFADHAAVALEHAWRFRELEDRLGALKAAPQG